MASLRRYARLSGRSQKRQESKLATLARAPCGGPPRPSRIARAGVAPLSPTAGAVRFPGARCRRRRTRFALVLGRAKRGVAERQRSVPFLPVLRAKRADIDVPRENWGRGTAPGRQLGGACPPPPCALAHSRALRSTNIVWGEGGVSGACAPRALARWCAPEGQRGPERVRRPNGMQKPGRGGWRSKAQRSGPEWQGGRRPNEGAGARPPGEALVSRRVFDDAKRWGVELRPRLESGLAFVVAKRWRDRCRCATSEVVFAVASVLC